MIIPRKKFKKIELYFYGEKIPENSQFLGIDKETQKFIYEVLHYEEETVKLPKFKGPDYDKCLENSRKIIK